MDGKMKTMKAVISKVKEEADEINTYTISLPEEIEFIPGQFVMTWFDEEPNLKRAYSIASSPLKKKEIELTIKKVAKFTSKLFEKKEGDKINVRGPFGHFTFKETDKHDLILIAGGTGITPLLCMMRYIKDKKLKNKVHLFYSNRTPETILYKEELDELNKEKNIEVIYTCTRIEEKDKAKWEGYCERINEKMIEKHVKTFENKIAYLCGAKEMVSQLEKMLLEHGVPKEQVKTEKW